MEAEQMDFSDYMNMMENQSVLFPLMYIEFLNHEDESVRSAIVKKPITGSSLSMDISSASVCRSVSLILDNSDKDFLPNIDTLWINCKFQLYLGYRDTLGREIYFASGEYLLYNSDPELISAYSSQTVNITAQDKWCILNNPIGHVYIINAGTKVTKAIRDILTLDEVGDMKVPVLEDLPDILPSDLRFSESATYGDILRSLANLYSRECFYDATGHFVLRKFATADVCEQVCNFVEGSPLYMGSTLQMKYSNVFNHYYCIGSSMNDGTTYIGEAKNEDLTSGSCIQNIGDKPAPVITNAKLTSNDLCIQNAEMELLLSKREQQTIAINCIALFHITEGNKAVAVSDSCIGLYDKRFIIQQFCIQLDAKTAMTITGFLFNDNIDFDDRLTMSNETS